MLFGAYGYFAGDIQLDFWSEDEAFNARTLPYLISVCGVIVSLLLLAAPTQSTVVTSGPLNWRGTVELFVAMALYSLSFDYLGFIIATALFLFAAFWLLGERKWVVMSLIAILLPVGFWGVMRLLGIQLDAGELYYQLSRAGS